MTRRNLSHLETRGGVFWVRVVVPRHLRHRLKRREWRFSLRTRETGTARLRCIEATLAIERAHDPPRIVLAGDKAPFAVARVAVGIV
jgi:hypothetical protein